MIRIYLCQNSDYKNALSFFFKSSEGIDVVGEASSISLLEREIHESQPDILLFDISMNGGLDFLRRIKKFAPNVKVMILTEVIELSVVQKCLRVGIDGYVILGKTSMTGLQDCVRGTYDGGFPISPSLMTEVLKLLSFNMNFREDLTKLTKREIEILQLLVNGMTYKEVSLSLEIALDTVRSHIKKIYEKLQVNSKSEAVVRALKEGIAVAL